MAAMQAVYYHAADGAQPVGELIEGLGPERQVAIDNRIDRLNTLTSRANPHLEHPDSSQVDGELRELRCHYGREHYRILYRQSGSLFILLHAFRKTTRQIPQKDVQVARRRWADFGTRMDAAGRTPPRPAGRDAP